MRVWGCGFEMNSITLEMLQTLTANPTIIANPWPEAGLFSCKVFGAASGTKKGKTHNFVSSNSNGPYFFRWAFWFDSLPTIEDRIIVVENSSSTDVLYITIDSSGLLRFYGPGGQIGSASSALVSGTRYVIEIKIDATPAGGSQVGEARLNGSVFATSSTLTYATGIDRMGFGMNLNSEAQTAGVLYFDDLCVNDSTGTAQNSYPGDGRIVHLYPNAAGDNAAWSLGGSSPAATDFGSVGETTPDSGVTFLSSGTTSGVIDDMNITDTPAAIKSYDTINCVAVGVQWNEAATGPTHPLIALRVKAAAAGTVTEDTATSLTQGTTFRINSVVSSPNAYLLNSAVQPGTSSAWTKATLDTAQIGVRLTNTPAHAAQVSALWLQVDTTPVQQTSGKGSFAFGAQSPTNGETPVSYQTFDNGSGSLPTIVGDADWGQLSLNSGQEARSRVYEYPDAKLRQYTINRDVYGTGSGSVTFYIRGSTTAFAQDDNTVTWNTYSGPTKQSWQYVQIRAVGA